MSLADVMSAAGLHVFAEVGLVIAVVIFAGVISMIFRRSNQATFERARFMPLDDDTPGRGAKS